MRAPFLQVYSIQKVKKTLREARERHSKPDVDAVNAQNAPADSDGTKKTLKEPSPPSQVILTQFSRTCDTHIADISHAIPLLPPG